MVSKFRILFVIFYANNLNSSFWLYNPWFIDLVYAFMSAGYKNLLDTGVEWCGDSVRIFYIDTPCRTYNFNNLLYVNLLLEIFWNLSTNFCMLQHWVLKIIIIVTMKLIRQWLYLSLLRSFRTQNSSVL